ncbi:hypothetical protein J6590_060847 [Homalodisca vitripennis]|nr:hypothetical protein J6590_060847 [Homalodisca vitripennis]
MLHSHLEAQPSCKPKSALYRPRLSRTSLTFHHKDFADFRALLINLPLSSHQYWSISVNQNLNEFFV